MSADVTTAVDNPYWDAVKDHVDPTGSLWGTPQVRGLADYHTESGGLDVERWMREAPQRADYVKRYSWTITDPATAAFVAAHSRGRLVDPLAGTGWWGSLLAQHGVDVVSYDLEPGGNVWHQDQPLHATVVGMDAVEAVVLHPDRTLLLSWPPHGEPVGVDVVRAYRGNRVVYIGEGDGGCCGDDAMFAELEANWVEVAEHLPVQWSGIHDQVRVFERKVS